MGQSHIKWTQQEFSNIIHLLKLDVRPGNIAKLLMENGTKGRNKPGIMAIACKVKGWLDKNPNDYIITPQQAELYEDAATIPPESFVHTVTPDLIGPSQRYSKMVATKASTKALIQSDSGPISPYAMILSLDQVVDTAKRVGAKEVNYHGITIKF